MITLPVTESIGGIASGISSCHQYFAVAPELKACITTTTKNVIACQSYSTHQLPPIFQRLFSVLHQFYVPSPPPHTPTPPWPLVSDEGSYLAVPILVGEVGLGGVVPPIAGEVFLAVQHVLNLGPPHQKHLVFVPGLYLHEDPGAWRTERCHAASGSVSAGVGVGVNVNIRVSVGVKYRINPTMSGDCIVGVSRGSYS